VNTDRNPSQFKVGEKVRVMHPQHRDFGKIGTIIKLDGVDDDQHGKARAHIRVSENVYIHVSLPNLAKEK
jgi:hypothetical protein